VTSAADDGVGSLRGMSFQPERRDGDRFDTQVFSPSKPTTIQVLSPQPTIDQINSITSMPATPE
jgi:hypothetical protein